MAAHAELTGLHALVVEDEYFVADDLKQILKQHGAELVQLSGDVADAFVQLRDGKFEFVLLNLNMHGEMAVSFADELLRRHLPFAFVSGYDRSKIPQRFAAVLNWGKPYDDRHIVADIQRLWMRPVSLNTQHQM